MGKQKCIQLSAEWLVDGITEEVTRGILRMQMNLEPILLRVGDSRILQYLFIL